MSVRLGVKIILLAIASYCIWKIMHVCFVCHKVDEFALAVTNARLPLFIGPSRVARSQTQYLELMHSFEDTRVSEPDEVIQSRIAETLTSSFMRRYESPFVDGQNLIEHVQRLAYQINTNLVCSIRNHDQTHAEQLSKQLTWVLHGLHAERRSAEHFFAFQIEHSLLSQLLAESSHEPLPSTLKILIQHSYLGDCCDTLRAELNVASQMRDLMKDPGRSKFDAITNTLLNVILDVKKANLSNDALISRCRQLREVAESDEKRLPPCIFVYIDGILLQGLELQLKKERVMRYYTGKRL